MDYNLPVINASGKCKEEISKLVSDLISVTGCVVKNTFDSIKARKNLRVYGVFSFE